MRTLLFALVLAALAGKDVLDAPAGKLLTTIF